MCEPSAKKSAFMHPNTQTIHTPVLLSAVLECLAPHRGESYLDVTAGYGGHATAVCQQTEAPERMTLVDRDATAIAALQPLADKGAALMHADFLTASQSLAEKGDQYDMILADLGVSSLHLDSPERGFSFRAKGPLDMRMDSRNQLTAATIVNEYDEQALVEILRHNGEEPRAKKIAAMIAARRPFADTLELADAIAEIIPKKGKIHPATRTFQALRIAVNDELGQLENSLDLWLSLLTPGGRLGVISFHSLEDRIVKQVFAKVSGERYDADFRLVTKKPVVGDDTEIVFNPRSRSAKLRVVAKIKNTERERQYANPRKK